MGDWFSFPRKRRSILFSCFSTVKIVQYAISFVNIFPSAIADSIFGILRLVMLVLVGSLSFIHRFNEGESSWLAIGLSASIYYAYQIKLNNKKKRECQELMEKQNANLEDELNQQKGLRETLEYVRNTLENKNEMDKVAELERKNLYEELEATKDKVAVYRGEIEKLRKEKSNANSELTQKTFENTRLREEFKTKVEKFQETLKEVKTLEEERNGLKRSLCEEKAKFKEKDDENQTLKITIEQMSTQRVEIMSKYTATVKELGEIKNENRELSKTISCQQSLRRQDTEKMGEIEVITQKLQSSLSTAKGRLSRVGGRLAGETRHCESPKSVMF